jgi:hypothetical protein
MASTIQIKNGTGSAVPSSLLQGELALNVHSGKLYYGTSGSSNAVSSSFEFDKLTVGEATITQLTSSIVSSSIIYSSGSNIFGDANTDNHTFNGDITASGNISSSGVINANQYNIQGKTLTTFASDILRHGFDSSLIKYSYGKDSDNEHLFYGNITASEDISGSLAGTVSAGSGSFHILQGDTSQPTALSIDGHITASGNISASHLLIDTFELEGNRFRIENDNFDIMDGGLEVNGHITSSGNISSSGILYMGEPGAGQTHEIYGRLRVIGSDITIGDGHISMSGNLVMTGSISGSSTTTASFAHIITSGETIEFRDGGTKLGDLKFDSSTGLDVNDGSGNKTKMRVGQITSDSVITGQNITASGNIQAAGNISASMTSTISAASASFNILKSNDTSVNGLEVTGFVSASNQSLAATGSFDTMTKAIVIETFTYFVNQNHTSELYVPLGGSTSEYTYDNYINKFACPYDGKVKRVSLQWQQNNPGDGAQVRVRKDTANGGAQDGDIGDSNAIFETVTKDGVVDDTIYHYDFSSSFAKGDTIGITVHTPNIATSNEYIYGTLVMEMDTST